MISLVLLTGQAPSILADKLLSSGYQVYEALAISEVLHLCEHHDIAAVLITPGVDSRTVNEIQSRFITLTLNADATPSSVIWELSHLLPGARAVQ